MKTTVWLFFIMMVAAAVMSEHLKPGRLAVPLSEAELEALVPSVIEDWRKVETLQTLIPNVELKAQIDNTYDAVLQRMYARPDGTRILLLLAYNRQQMGLSRAHRQELCYQSSGAEILDQEYVHLQTRWNTLPVMRLHTINGERQEPLTYWFTVGNRAAVAPGELLMAQLLAGLSGQAPEGFLVRVSMLSTDSRAAFPIQAAFIKAMLNSMPQSGAQRLSGEAKI